MRELRQPRSTVTAASAVPALTVAALMMGLLAWAQPAFAISIAPTGGFNSGVQAVDRLVDGHAHLSSVACPSATWCMVGAWGGTVVTYDGGTWGAPTTVFPHHEDVDGISCPTTTFCMAVSYLGGYSIFSGGTWSTPVTSPSGWGVTCPTTSFCLLEQGGFGDISAWDGKNWSLSFDTSADPNGSIGQTSSPLSCLPGDTKDCMYVDNHGYYTNYSGSWPAMALVPKSLGAAGAVSCSQEPMAGAVQGGRIYPVGATPTCTVVDATGHAFTFRSATWTAQGRVDRKASTPDLTGVSCVYARCAAVDQSRHVLYEDLFGGSGSWSRPFRLGAVGSPEDISCASLSFCVVVTASSTAVILDPSL